MENAEMKWTQLLINWLDKCVIPNEVDDLSARYLVEIVDKYKEDVCRDDIDRAILCTDDVEPFIEYKYPILRLRNLGEVQDYPKKLYIMTSILLYYCCMNSKTGQVDADICERLTKEDQEVILKFCEVLKDMEVTISNVETAITAAFERQPSTENINRKDLRSMQDDSYYLAEPSASVRSDATSKANVNRTTVLQFKSSVTLLPSVVTDTSLTSFSEASDFHAACAPYKNGRDQEVCGSSDSKDTIQVQEVNPPINCLGEVIRHEPLDERKCLPDCACSRCSATGPCCADPGCTKDTCADNIIGVVDLDKWKYINWKLIGIICSGFLLVIMVALSTIPFWKKTDTQKLSAARKLRHDVIDGSYLNHEAPDWTWECRKNFCHKVFRPKTDKNMYSSLSRCTLLCMGPQLWPYPIGYTYFSKAIVAISTSKLEYKFQSVPSDSVHQYLAEAFKLFLKDLIRLEKVDLKPRNHTQDLKVKKMIIQIDVESDADPRLRVNTEEAYTLRIETVNNNQVVIKIASVSFCGVRHGLETLSQVILLDQSTGYLITLSNMIIKDAPSYKYRGLMIDTGRNYIPVIDLMRTIDAMATCKLNTFHWRISDVTSFPLELMKLPEFAEYGPYDREKVYTKEDVKSIVSRANVRGIRVLIEVAVPGPVGRPWSWVPEATCPRKNDNFTCDNVLCLRLKMEESLFDILETIYAEILEMTNVDDVFHLSDSVFSLISCYYLVDDRDGFLDKALVRLKQANKGFLPKLPIIWYTSHLTRDYEAKTWDRLGVQLNDWDPNPSEQYLSQFKVIHSTKWDLSCEMRKQRCTKYRTWQQMYAWKSWRNVEVFTIEGGESILWTDLVDSIRVAWWEASAVASYHLTGKDVPPSDLAFRYDAALKPNTCHTPNRLARYHLRLHHHFPSGNLDYHLWPRAAAVAERLWSDMIANSSANKFVYMRLDTHRWRMLLRGVKVQPIWPAWCSFNPSSCLEKVQ